MRKTPFLLFLIVLSSIIAVQAQDKKNSPKEYEGYSTIKEGKGMDGVNIGKSTMDDIVKKFGKDYKWIVNKKYSYQMNYEKLGLSFYMCQSDKKKQIFVIELRPPYRAKTSKGIILGKSTLEDVQKTYGKLKSGLEYRGISFYYRKLNGRNLVTSMDVTENSGIRQCDKAK
jgi:hypothetical protein